MKSVALQDGILVHNILPGTRKFSGYPQLLPLGATGKRGPVRREIRLKRNAYFHFGGVRIFGRGQQWANFGVTVAVQEIGAFAVTWSLPTRVFETVGLAVERLVCVQAISRGSIRD